MSFQRAAKLVLQLVDNVSRPAQAIQQAMIGVNTAMTTAGNVAMAPARAVAAGGKAIRRSVTDMTVASGALTFGLAAAAKSVYEMEDILNEIEGRRFGKNDIFNLADGTEMTRDAFRKRVTDLIAEINKTSPRNAVEISKAYNQLVQAGLTHEQVEGVLPIAIDFAIAGDYDTEEAADKLTNMMTSLRLVGSTTEEVRENALRVADTIAYAANITNSDVAQMSEAFKYAAPSAAALGISVEQLSAMAAVLAQRGIKGSEAGVALRSMLTRMIRPTNMAAERLAAYNIDLADYLETSREVNAEDVSNTFTFSGMDIRGAQAEIQTILDSAESTGEKVKQITAAIMKEVGDSSTLSASQISNTLSETLFGFTESLDVERLIADMEKANIAVADFFRIFDQRQGGRLLSLFSADLGAWIDDIEMHADGFAEALRKTRMKGIVGAVARLSASMVDLFRAAAASGVLDTATKAISNFAESIVKLAKVDPELIKMGTYALMGVAAIAPLGFALTGLAAAAGLAINPIAWVGAGLAYLAYLNLDGIISYVRAFGAAVQENIGPRTAHLIQKARELLGDLFSTQDFDGAGDGKQHGSWLMNWIESEIAGIENMLAADMRMFNAIGGYVTKSVEGLQRGWSGFSTWWDQMVVSVNEGANRYVNTSIEGLARGAAAIQAGASQLYSAGMDMVQSLWDGAVAKFNEFIEWVKGIPGRIRSAIGRISLSDVISFGGFGGGGESAPAEGSAPPKRALGGPIKAGLTYQINEHEQEFITPNFNGRVHRPRDIGGGASVVFNNRFVLGAGATKAQADDIFRELDSQLNRAAQVAFGSGNTYGGI